MNELSFNQDRKFIFVETAFFARWYEEQPSARRELVKRLVKSGQLEFINGGWCMHDEAAPFYVEMVDQTTRGHQFIKREFGEDAAPKGTWQIDPFGHSNTQAWLLSAEAGMYSLFWGRTDYQDRMVRWRNKGLEWIWEGSQSLGADARVFAGELYGLKGQGGYSCPLNFDRTSLEQVEDNPKRYDYNVEMWIEKVVGFAKEQQAHTRTNHIMWACGNDFAYSNAAAWYHNFDKLIHYARMDGRVNLVYSTPSIYSAAKMKARVPDSWEIRRDDMFPLADKRHQYWTGYFTSRPALKRQVRTASGLLNAARQIEVLSGNKLARKSTEKAPPVVGVSWTDAFEGSIGVATHHDGMSGTARQSVTNDYEQRMSDSQAEVEDGINNGLQKLMSSKSLSRESATKLAYCRDLNMSVCVASSTSDKFTVVAWNALSRSVEQVIQLPVYAKDGEGFDVQVAGKSIESQLLPLDDRTLGLPLLYINSYNLSKTEMAKLHSSLANPANRVLTAKVSLPAVGYARLDVSRRSSSSLRVQHRSSQGEDKVKSFSNGVYKVILDPKSNEVVGLENELSNVHTPFRVQWGWYESSAGGCTAGYGCDSQASGAYMFRPNSSTFFSPNLEASAGEIKTEVVEGPLVIEIRQYISSWASHVIRLVKGEPYVEVEYTCGPIPLRGPGRKDVGKEVAIRYASDLKSYGVFYTDSNGREMIKRERDERGPSYPKLDVSEPIAGNYYPVNAMIALEEESGRAQLAVMPDVSQGGSSIHDGELELMVHRRLMRDDNRGVQEPLNETMCGCNDLDAPKGTMGTHAKCWCKGLTVRGTHRIVLDTPVKANHARRQIVDQMYYRPTLAFTQDSSTFAESTPAEFSALAQALPENVNLMTLTNNYAGINDGKLLLRFAHVYGIDEHPELSEPVKITLSTLFSTASGLKIVAAEETSLTGNQPREKMLERGAWLLGDAAKRSQGPFARSGLDLSDLSFKLRPMELRTFLCTVTRKDEEGAAFNDILTASQR